MGKSIVIGGGGPQYTTHQSILLKYANRHGLIAGATGTGKTVTLQAMAERFSQAGVPVFMADAKSDLSGMAKAGSSSAKLHKPFMERAKRIALHDFEYIQFPVAIWDAFGKEGIPAKITIESMGAQLFSKMLELTDAQEGIMSIVFAVARNEELPLYSLKDLRSVLTFVSENARQITLDYGNVTPASVGAIQRKLLTLDLQGASEIFGRPALCLDDMMQFDDRGYGQVNVLAAERLMRSPVIYGVFLLWMLTDLFKRLPEVGDMDRPKFAFFFDEAHMLFANASRLLLRTVEQVVRLIRSKGVGVYFVTQSPADVPDSILGQLGNRVQHALRAFTAKDQKAVAAAAQTFRRNERFSTDEAIRNMGVGEALTSFLDDKGTPTVVERTLIRPPSSQVGPITDDERSVVTVKHPLYDKYGTPITDGGADTELRRRASLQNSPADNVIDSIIEYVRSTRT